MIHAMSRISLIMDELHEKQENTGEYSLKGNHDIKQVLHDYLISFGMICKE